MTDLSIVIPAYNEVDRIGTTLELISGYLARLGLVSEVIVIDDGSVDGTAALVDHYHDRFDCLQLIELPDNRGKGYAVRVGMLRAQGRVRVFCDADGSTPIEELEGLLPSLVTYGGAAEVVAGSIAVPGSRVEESQSRPRTWAGRVGNRLIRTLLLPGIHDSQRGFKAFTAAAAEAVFNRTRVNGWGFDVEALALARALGLAVAEVPVRWRHHPNSRVRPSSYLTTLREVLAVRWRLWKGGYQLEPAQAASGLAQGG